VTQQICPNCGKAVHYDHTDDIGMRFFKCEKCGQQTAHPRQLPIEREYFCENCIKLDTTRCKFKDDPSRPSRESIACPDYEGKPILDLNRELKSNEKMHVVQKPSVLTDTFLAEEIWDRKDPPKYYVKYFDENPSEIMDQIDLGEVDSRGKSIIYVPVDNQALRKGLVILPSEPKETTFKEVFEKADKFAFDSYDPCGRESVVRLLNRVVIGSWFLDRFVANPRYDVAGSGKFAPIIPLRGPSQSGKNRFAFVLRLISYRPYFEMSTYRIPSLYRPLDLWNGTLVLDEADFSNTNEKSELIHFLNCRATGTPISRQDTSDPKITNVFSNFGQTIVTQRRVFDDNATESRCLPFYSEVTDKRLPTVETDEMLKEGLELQNMLFYLRLEYFKKVTIDKSAWLKDISDPRLCASLLPLMALSKFDNSISETIRETVRDVERLKIEQKANSEDGMFVNALWEKGVFEQYSGVPNNEHYYIKVLQNDASENGETIERTMPLTVGALADEFHMTHRNTRKILNSLNLCSPGLPRSIKVSDKNYRVIFFDPPKFEKRLKEFVIGYEPFKLYDLLNLQKPATDATDATDKLHGSLQLDGFIKQPKTDEGCVGSVATVASVTEKVDLTHG